MEEIVDSKNNYFAGTWWLINNLYHSDRERTAFIQELGKSGNIAKVYRGIPIKRHFLILGSIDPEFKKYSSIDTSGRSQTVHSINKLSPEDILQTLLGFYSDEKAFQELTKKASIETHLLSEEEKKPVVSTTQDEEKVIGDRDKKIKDKEESASEETVKSAEEQFKSTPTPTENIDQNNINTNPVTISGTINTFNESTPTTSAAAQVLDQTQNTIKTTSQNILNNPNLKNTAQNVLSSAQINARNIGSNIAEGTKNWINEAVTDTFGGGTNSSGIAQPIVSTNGSDSPLENQSDLETYHAGQHMINPDLDTQNNRALSPEDRALFEENFKTATSWNNPDEPAEQFVEEDQDQPQPGQRITRRELQNLQREFESQEEVRQVEQLPRRGLQFNRRIEVPESFRNIGSQAQIRVGQGIQATSRGLGSAGRGLLGNVGRLFGLGGGSAAGGAAVGGGAAAGGAAAAGGTAAAGGLAAVGWPVLVVILIIVGVIILFLLLFFFINYWQETNALFPPFQQTAINAPTNPGNGVCPETIGNKDRNTCRYLNPSIDIFNKNIDPATVNTYIAKYSPIFVNNGLGNETEFRRRTNYIIQQAQSVGLNPALFLGYWKSESNFGTIRNAATLGCAPTSGTLTFESEVNCAVGLSPDGKNPGGALASRCASSRDANSEGCRALKESRENTTVRYPPNNPRYSNADIYKDYPLTYPITTFDNFAEAYGSSSPLLGEAEGVVNNNCINSYNTLIEVAKELNACTSGNSTGDELAQCLFTKQGSNPPNATYKSPRLINYFKEVESQTGVPAIILGAFTRVESTTGEYSISDYTDEDIAKMENTSQIVNNIDRRIEGTQKALCPVSEVGALGLMQMVPQPRIGNEVVRQLNQNRKACRDNPGFCRYSERPYFESGIAKGASFIPKDYTTLSVEDYCNPKKNLQMGAGWIIMAMKEIGYGDGTKWDPSWTTNRKAITDLVRRYYGGTIYGPNDEFNYADDLWNSLQQCKPSGGNNPNPNPNPPGGNFVFYCQSGNPWGNQCVINKTNCEQAIWGTPPTKCTYGQAACGPTSFAMVASSLGINMNPIQAATQFVNNGTFTCEAGTTGMLSVYNTQFFKDKFIAGPDVVTSGQLNMQRAKETFDAGYKYIIGSAGQFPLVTGGRFDHIFVVESIDIAKNEVVIRDPAKCSDGGIRRFKPNEFNWKYAHGIKLK